MNQPNQYLSDGESPAISGGGNPAISDRMRELLARAAQDHLDEQRTHGEAVEEVQQRLENIEWVLGEVRESEISAVRGQLAELRSYVDEAFKKSPDWAEGLAERIDVLNDKTKPVAELPSLWADVSTVAESVDEALGRLQTIADRNQQAVSQVDELSTRVDSLADDVSGRVVQHVEQLTERIDKLQTSLDSAASRFSRVDKSLEELQQCTDRLERDISAITERLDQGLDGVNGRVEGVGGRLDGVDGRFEGLFGRLEGVDDRLESVHNRIEQLPATFEVSELHRRLVELTQRPAVDPSEQLSGLSTQAGELLSEVRERPSRDEVEQSLSTFVEATHADTSQRLNALEETMMVLAEMLLRPGAATETRTQQQSQGAGQQRSQPKNQARNQSKRTQSKSSGGGSKGSQSSSSSGQASTGAQDSGDS